MRRKQKTNKKLIEILERENDRIKENRKMLPRQSVIAASYLWPLKMFLLTFGICLFSSVLSELTLSASGFIVSVVIIIFFMLISIVFDILGVAASACDALPFEEMVKMKVRGAAESLMLVRHAEKVASFSCDIVGDVCSILSGSASAAIVLKISELSHFTGNVSFVFAALISSFIAALTVFGKAIGKTVAMKKSVSIMLKTGVFINAVKLFFKKKEGRLRAVKKRRKDGSSKASGEKKIAVKIR